MKQKITLLTLLLTGGLLLLTPLSYYAADAADTAVPAAPPQITTAVPPAPQVDAQIALLQSQTGVAERKGTVDTLDSALTDYFIKTAQALDAVEASDAEPAAGATNDTMSSTSKKVLISQVAALSKIKSLLISILRLSLSTNESLTAEQLETGRADAERSKGELQELQNNLSASNNGATISSLTQNFRAELYGAVEALQALATEAEASLNATPINSTTAAADSATSESTEQTPQTETPA
jgi:hypothetical protein